MTTDPAEFLQPRQPEHSNVYLEYQPSPDLNSALREFIKPDLQGQRRFGMIALRSEAYYQVPLATDGHALKYHPKRAEQLHDYGEQVRKIENHRLYLSPRLDVHRFDSGGVALHFEIFPEEFERRHLGELALSQRDDLTDMYPAIVYFHKSIVAEDYEHAIEELEGAEMFDSHHRPHLAYAPRHRFWLERTTLLDRSPLHLTPPPTSNSET